MTQTKVLFLTTPEESHIQDQILIGLKRVENCVCVDYPRKDQVYSDCEKPNSEMFGNGFTVWKAVEEDNIDHRENIRERLEEGEFDVVVFGAIQRQRLKFSEFRDKGLLRQEDTDYIFIDGQDYHRNRLDFVIRRKLAKLLHPDIEVPVYRGDTGEPYYPEGVSKLGRLRRTLSRRIKPFNNYPLVLPVFEPALRYGKYFKRELDSQITERFEDHNIFPIGLCIPEEKISDFNKEKTQKFQTHVVNSEAFELEEIRENSTTEPIFDMEENYFEDLRSSYFGITEKRWGWDAVRHYEIALNGAIPAFHKLRRKPHNAPPYGLQDMENCIAYEDANELKKKTEYILENEELYKRIQRNTEKWIRQKTCKKQAERLLKMAGVDGEDQN